MIPARYKASLGRVIIAPDSFKGTLSAERAAQAIAQGIHRVLPDCQVDLCPVADGGEGSLAAIHAATGGDFCDAQVVDPVGRPCQARWLHVPEENLGLIELAEASGLMRLTEADPSPLHRTTYGTGQLLRCAIEAGCKDLVLFVGGSATVDGGVGMAQALGVKFFDSRGTELSTALTPKHYQSIARIEHTPASPRWRSLTVACDVTNPLTGAHGAAQIYGPQKGASPEDVAALDAALLHLASLFPGVDSHATGVGAAGGAAFGAIAILGGSLVSGIDTVLEIVNFKQRCQGASLAITGEGQLDGQSGSGKTCYGVALAAKSLKTPTIAIVGRTAPGFESALQENGGPLTEYIDLSAHVGISRARSEPDRAIETALEQWLTQESFS